MAFAHLNVGTLRYSWDDSRVAEFVDNVARVNGLASRSPGFIWRLEDEASEIARADPERTGIGAPNVIFTLSMWADVASFAHFVEKTLHGRFMAKRQDWFKPSPGPSHVIWPVADDERPSLAQAVANLEHLGAHGPSETVFDLAYARESGWIAHKEPTSRP